MLIVTTATLSLLLIGLLALSMTPGRGGSPAAVEATTARPTTHLAALEQPPLPMVTPLGDEGWAVTTSGAVGSRVGIMAARLPSGDVVDVEIVRRDTDSGVTLVSVPQLTRGYELAASSPGPSDTVVVHGVEPQIVPMVEVSGLEVAEGTPVLDDQGALVGICTKVATGITVMTVSTMPGPVATSTTTLRPTTTAVTSVPGATPVVTTTVPGSAHPTTTTPSPTTVGTSTLPVTSSTVATIAPTTSVSGGAASTTAPG